LQLRTIDYALWIASPCVLIGVLIFMRKRGLSSRFPVFSGYLIFQIVTDILLLTIQPFSYAVYYYSYWVTTVVGILFTFALIDELFRVAFRNFAAMRNVGSSIFRWGVLLLLLAAILIVVEFPHVNGTYGISGAVLMGDRVARGMLGLMVMLLLLGARYLHIPVRSTLFGIALGFFVYMFGKVILDSITLQHFSYLRVTTRVSAVIYISSSLLWMFYARYGSGLPPRPTVQLGPDGDPMSQPRPLLDAINAMVEESMRKLAEKP
jgi:hypothetical protein